jgi:hypothetical protein
MELSFESTSEEDQRQHAPHVGSIQLMSTSHTPSWNDIFLKQHCLEQRGHVYSDNISAMMPVLTMMCLNFTCSINCSFVKSGTDLSSFLIRVSSRTNATRSAQMEIRELYTQIDEA